MQKVKNKLGYCDLLSYICLLNTNDQMNKAINVLRYCPESGSPPNLIVSNSLDGHTYSNGSPNIRFSSLGFFVKNLVSAIGTILHTSLLLSPTPANRDSIYTYVMQWTATLEGIFLLSRVEFRA